MHHDEMYYVVYYVKKSSFRSGVTAVLRPWVRVDISIIKL